MPSSSRRLIYRRRTKSGLSEIAQFVPVLYVLFLLVLMPLLDVVNIFVAAATQYLATNDVAAKAATQSDYSTALNSMAQEAFVFQSSGLAKFAQMQPAGGYVGCGDDMYVLSTNIANGTVASSPANQSITQPVDTKVSMYELSVRSLYSISPIISFSAIPVLQDVPGLGKPVILTFSACRPIEHPGGLEGQAPSGTVVAGVNPFARVASNPGGAAQSTPITWRNPNIFQQIQAAGETVVSINVFVVPADTAGGANNGWVTSGVSVLSQQNVWIDTQAVGTWATSPGYPSDANGFPSENAYSQWFVDTGASPGALIGWIGNAPPLVPAGEGGTTSPSMFSAGNTTTNYTPSTSGPIYMMCNDNCTEDDTGAQLVRIVVTSK